MKTGSPGPLSAAVLELDVGMGLLKFRDSNCIDPFEIDSAEIPDRQRNRTVSVTVPSAGAAASPALSCWVAGCAGVAEQAASHRTSILTNRLCKIRLLLICLSPYWVA